MQRPVDGTERLISVNGKTVLLHPECQKYYRPGGWSFGASATPLTLHSSL